MHRGRGGPSSGEVQIFSPDWYTCRQGKITCYPGNLDLFGYKAGNFGGARRGVVVLDFSVKLFHAKFFCA